MVDLPAHFAAIPRAPLLFPGPTPIQHLDRLTAGLDCGAQFWIKREDCNSGLAAGGNKVRKLEYIVPDVLSQGADTLVTEGGIQSNHMRQTAAVAAKYGLKVVLLADNPIDSNEMPYNHLGNAQIFNLLSAEVITDVSEDHIMTSLRSQGRKPYFIPSGGSTHPLGGLGFARWAFELIEQERQSNLFYDTIILALASGSTTGGMLAGFKYAKHLAQRNGETVHQRRIIAIQTNTKPKDQMIELVSNIAEMTISHLLPGSGSYKWEEDFELDNRFHAGAYGHLDEATIAAVKELASWEGILADPVYTGKAVTGMLAMARGGELDKSKNVLFVHTGGQSSISAYPALG